MCAEALMTVGLMRVEMKTVDEVNGFTFELRRRS